MRQLHIFRERALFCFGVPYYLITDCKKEELIEAAEIVGYPASLNHPMLASNPIQNGGKISVEIPEEGTEFVVAVFRESAPLVTETASVPAGCEDVSYLIKTDYNGHNKIQLSIEQA